MKTKWRYVFVSVVVLGMVLGYVGKEKGLISPSLIKVEERVEDKFITVGFLPTWMVGKTRLYGDEIDRLVFSSVAIEGDGSIVWDTQGKKVNNEEYLKLKNNVKRYGNKNILGIKQFDDKKIDKILGDPEARSRMLKEVGELVNSGGFDGVNIDFEYMSNYARMLDDDFLQLFDEAKAAGWGETSIDVFANTVIKGDHERLAKAGEKIDYIIVMAYDFRRPGSKSAGPVAPMGATPGERNIGEIVNKIKDFNLDSKKYVLAYPLYGYEWQTMGKDFRSATMAGGYGKTVFYSEGVGMTNVAWDEESKSPWAAWTEMEKRSRVTRKKVGRRYVNQTTYYYVDQWHQAYFENEQSLMIKLQLAKDSGMRGTGYWALGYEGKDSPLLSELDSKLHEIAEK